MSDALRGLVLLVSVVLWLPVLRPVLSGEMTTAEGGVRYAGALILAWGGVSLLAAVVNGYSSPDAEEGPRAALAEEAGPSRRTEDPPE
jgi:hypothetical protein